MHPSANIVTTVVIRREIELLVSPWMLREAEEEATYVQQQLFLPPRQQQQQQSQPGSGSAHLSCFQSRTATGSANQSKPAAPLLLPWHHTLRGAHTHTTTQVYFSYYSPRLRRRKRRRRRRRLLFDSSTQSSSQYRFCPHTNFWVLGVCKVPLRSFVRSIVPPALPFPCARLEKASKLFRQKIRPHLYAKARFWRLSDADERHLAGATCSAGRKSAAGAEKTPANYVE